MAAPNLPRDRPGRARILGVTKSTGGVAAYNRALIERLRDKGYSVGVVCLSDGNEFYAKLFAAQGIPATTMAMARYSIAPASDLRLAVRLVRHVRRRPVDLIIAHGAKAGFLCRLVGRLAGIPVIYVMHSTPFLSRVQGRRAFGYRQLEHIGSGLGGHFVVISQSMHDELARQKIAPASRITMIHTGIDLPTLRPSVDRAAACRALGLDPRRPVVGWAGRMNPQKAPLDFVLVADQLTRSITEVQLLMVGEGPLADEVRALADRLGLGNRLLVADWQDDMDAVFPALDVYCATSRWEGLPLTLMEAMAAERPVVATAVDGVAEVIRHGIDGFLVDIGDLGTMAQHLEGLLLDDGRRAEMGRAARVRVTERFTVERMMNTWEHLIDVQLSASDG